MKNTALKTAPINRSGLIDIWNAFMVENADFSNHDIPLCPTTATSIPSKLIAWNFALLLLNFLPDFAFLYE